MIKIHIFHTGSVCIAPDLAFGGRHSNILKASGLFLPKSKRIWLPVSAYLIEHPKGKILVDCGWHRDMSPNGVFDKQAQIKSLGSRLLYHVNQGVVPKGQSIDEQLKQLDIEPQDLDYVLLTHLDCDHANGLKQVADAQNILVSEDEYRSANQSFGVRYQKKWWSGVHLQPFKWNGTEGVAHKSYDLFGDGSIQLISIPGHSQGLFAVKIKNDEKYVLLYSDGGYSSKSWKEMITSGISTDKDMQIKSLKWIRDESIDPNCVMSVANHDPNVEPQIIEL